MKNMILAVMLAAAPAAAQTAARAPASRPSVIPGLGASFDGVRLGAAPLPMPALSASALAPALVPALAPALAPALVRPAPAAAKPIEGSPLGVIRDAAAGETRKAAALDRLFDDSAPSNSEAVERLVSRIPDAVLFDWDDTLADERAIVRATHEELFRRFGLKMPSHEELENQWRADHAVFYARFFPGVPTEEVEDVWHGITERLRRGEEINDKRLERAALFPGAVEILKALKAMDVPMAVVSNKREEALLREIQASGLRPYFKHVHGHMDGRQRKPSPQPIEATLKLMGAAPANAWYIGDQLSDMEAALGLLRVLIGREPARMARERGMHDGPAGGIVFIDALSELMPILRRLHRPTTGARPAEALSSR